MSLLGGIRPRDLRIAAIVAAVQIGGTIGASHRHPHRGCWWTSSCTAPTHLDALAIVLMAIGPIALLARRRHPRAVLAVVFAVGLLFVCLGYVQGPNYASLAVAVFSAALAGDRIAARVAVLAGWILFLWLPAAIGKTGAPTWLAALSIAAWLLLLLGAAEAISTRRERFAEARRVRQQEARRKAGEERLRIARELHDVLAHNISLINVQSGVALHLIDEQPEQARIALQAINEASADALQEVRSALSALRGDGEQPPRAPTAGLDGIDELVTRASAGGIDVSLEVQGERHPLPAAVELAAFRIVQESLTNVVRHAAARTAQVRLAYGDRDLVVLVEDDGRGGVRGNGGSGIAGMRERAATLGGTLDVGPAPGGGFRVQARLPLGSSK